MFKFKSLPLTVYVSIIVITLILSILLIIIGSKVKKLKVDEKPSKFMALILTGVDGFNSFIKGTVGKKWKYVAPLTLALGIAIFFTNISGMFGMDTPSKYISVTLAFSIISVLIVQSTGVVSQGWRHIKTLFQPFPFMFPMNLMSDVTPLISMTVRLFGNIVSGSILIMMIYHLLGFAAPIVAAPLHLLFDLGFGFIQTVVFVLLTVIFASNKVDENDLLDNVL